MKNNILVPVDFGKQSIIALDYAKYFAQSLDAQIHLLTVVEESGFLKNIIDPEYQEKIEREAYKALEKLADDHLHGFNYKLHVKNGKPYEQIEDLADEIQPTMIIMGKTENPSLAKRILGSNTLHVIQETDYPVVSVRGQIEPQQLAKTILLPLDLAKPVTEQVNTAIEFAKMLKADIYAISVDIKEDIAYETQVLTGMNKVKKTIEAAGLKCQTEIIEGKKSQIVDIINQYAQKINPLLTVIMLRSENEIGDFLIGTVARSILETLSHPVLSVKPWNPEVKENPIIKIIYDPMGIL